MGVLSFVGELQRQGLEKRQAELDRQQRLAEIAARGGQTIAEQNNAARLNEEAIKNEAARQWMTTAKAGIQQREDLAANLVAHGMNPQEATVEAARQQHAIRVEPELLKSSSARSANEFNAGRMPLMSSLGQTSTQADITGEKAREGENLNKYLTSAETRVSAPMAARAANEASTAGSNMTATAANAAVPLLPKVTSATQLSDIAQAGLKQQQAAQQGQVLAGVNPALASQAENAANQATAANAGLVTRSSGLLAPGAGGAIASNPMTDQTVLQSLIPLISSAIRGAPAAVPGTNAVPSRPGVLFNLNSLRTPAIPSH